MRSTSRLITGRSSFLAVVALSALAACGSDSSTAATVNVAGTYNLQTVDGVALPAPGKDATGAIAGKVNSGALVLSPGNSYTSVINYVLSNGTPIASSGSGTYTVSGGTMVLTGSDGKANTVSFTGGNTVTGSVNGQTYVFTKS